jgi:hypothetical protein
MDIAKISADQALVRLGQGGRTEEVALRQARTEGANAPAPEIPTFSAGRLSEGLAKAQEETAGRSGLARGIRQADASMEKINAYVQQMKAQLERVVKFFPPFPPGDPQREEYLKDYAGMRKLINELTIPPDNQDAARIMADPAVYPGAGTVEISTGAGTEQVAVSRQVHAGPSGLNIPDLVPSASDAEIHGAINDLSEAGQKISEKRLGLASDASMLSGLIGDQGIAIPSSGAAAVVQSGAVRSSLSGQAGPGLTGAAADLVQLV